MLMELNVTLKDKNQAIKNLSIIILFLDINERYKAEICPTKYYASAKK